MEGYLDLVVPVVPAIAPYVPHLRNGMFRFDIVSPIRGAYLLGQLAVESAVFTDVEENFNYRSDRLIELFGTNRISVADANRFGRSADGTRPARQNPLANILYGGTWGAKNLGNTEPGDGWRFRGRGLKQITGRTNYTQISHLLYGDDRLVDQPDLVLEPEAAALTACAFWHLKGLSPWADAENIVELTRRVNKGLLQLEGPGGRRWWTDRFKRMFCKAGIIDKC